MQDGLIALKMWRVSLLLSFKDTALESSGAVSVKQTRVDACLERILSRCTNMEHAAPSSLPPAARYSARELVHNTIAKVFRPRTRSDRRSVVISVHLCGLHLGFVVKVGKKKADRMVLLFLVPCEWPLLDRVGPSGPPTCSCRVCQGVSVAKRSTATRRRPS